MRIIHTKPSLPKLEFAAVSRHERRQHVERLRMLIEQEHTALRKLINESQRTKPITRCVKIGAYNPLRGILRRLIDL